MITKEPFQSSYIAPSLDYYCVEKISVNYDDYDYFELQRRFGPSWWIAGFKNGKSKEIGRLDHVEDLARFIEWCTSGYGGSKLVTITAISTSFDILKTISELLKSLEVKKDVK